MAYPSKEQKKQNRHGQQTEHTPRLMRHGEQTRTADKTSAADKARQTDMYSNKHQKEPQNNRPGLISTPP